MAKDHTNFFNDVYEVVKLIPPGRVTNYGAIGAYLGAKSSARMVGWAMNAAHGLDDVPAHRVVNRVGVLTGRHHFSTPTIMQERLEAEGTPTRVVSMPSTELFDQQDSSYKASVLPSDALKASIEALTTYGWERYTGIDGVNIGIDTFGASAPADALYKHFGITADALIDAVKQKL